MCLTAIYQHVGLVRTLGSADRLESLSYPRSNYHYQEEVDLPEYLDYHGAYHQIGRFLGDVYVHGWTHSALGYLIPAEFEARRREEHVLALELEPASFLNEPPPLVQDIYSGGPHLSRKVVG